MAFGGVASGTSILSAGAETILAGGTIFNGTVGPGGYMGLGYDPGNAPPVAGGTASGTNVSGGGMNVETGGLAVSTTISGGGGFFGGMTVSMGGSASETTVGNSGGLNVSMGGVATDTHIVGGFMGIDIGRIGGFDDHFRHAAGILAAATLPSAARFRTPRSAIPAASTS